MKVYLIQEDYTCEVENGLGECNEEKQSYVQAVCLSRDMMLKALADVIVHNAEEYYDVDIRDYRIYEADVEDGGYVTLDSREFSFVNLTDVERASVEQEITRLTNERIEKYGG